MMFTQWCLALWSSPRIATMTRIPGPLSRPRTHTPQTLHAWLASMLSLFVCSSLLSNAAYTGSLFFFTFNFISPHSPFFLTASYLFCLLMLLLVI